MDIKSVKFLKSSTQLSELPEGNVPEYAFVGRSNVGKSSLINKLCNRKKLAKISSTPGKTKLINHFHIDDAWYLVDLPGYGYAKVSKTDRAIFGKMIHNYVLNREVLCNTFLLVDSRIPAQKSDMAFMELLGKNAIAFSIVFTKSDKLGKTTLDKSVAAYKRELKKVWDELPPIFVTSAENGKGIPEILAYISKINEMFFENK